MKKGFSALILLAISLIANVALAQQSAMDSYLFVYFTGNSPEQEQICYALSQDGYNYTPLNHGKPVIASDSIALTGSVRDPHILRCEDGKSFYMVTTDMRSSNGWSSNRGIVLMKSDDLVNWTHSTVHFPTKWWKKWRNVTRVWAPEVIYDRAAGKYLVYFSLATSDHGSYDRIYYCYANSDFTDLVGEPRLLFDNGASSIDGNIVWNSADNRYHLFYKGTNKDEAGIYQATSESLTGKWETLPGRVEQTKESVEGVGVCQSLDGKSWVVMYDCFGNGHYQFCKSADLKTFQLVQNTETKGAFTPRHGTIIPITKAKKRASRPSGATGTTPSCPTCTPTPKSSIPTRPSATTSTPPPTASPAGAAGP